MEIFLSGEIEGPATHKWFKLQKEFSSSLLKFSEMNYGENLTSISIISILVSDEYLSDGGYKERRYYNKKRREADIRLRINYKDFLRSSEAKQRQIYIAHILDSIRVAGEKAGEGFDTERLLNDVQLALTE